MFRKNSSSKKNFGRKLFVILFGVVGGFALFHGFVNSTVDFTSYLVFPIQKRIYSIGTSIKETSDAITKYKEVLEENKHLQAENIKYEQVVAYNNELLDENERLRKILGMKEENKLDIKVAKVNFRNQNNLYERFFIDLGSKDGMAPNMIVLTGDNKLIGKIGKVYNDYSVVDMITGENSNVSALSESNMLGIVKGSNEDDGTLYFEPNTFQNILQVGEKIYTSGISDIYPKGLYIGDISEIDEAQGDVFRSIKVKNDVDAIDISEVLILMPKTKKEEKKV